jgi:rRNA-processing protein FCF1
MQELTDTKIFYYCGQTRMNVETELTTLLYTLPIVPKYFIIVDKLE